MLSDNSLNSQSQRSADFDPCVLLAVLEQAPGFFCFLRGRELVFELANASCRGLIGDRDLIGKPLRDALPELSGQGYFELLEKVFDTRERFIGHDMKVSLASSDGRQIDVYLDFIYQPVLGAGGETLGVLVQGYEVTETHVLAAERDRSERRYHALFASIEEGFCIMQLLFDERDTPIDYRFLEANAAFEEQTGLRNVTGKTARELVPELDESWFRLYGQVALTGEPARFENHAPAMQRWFEVSATRFGAPEQRQVALLFKNITKRKLAEAEVERAKVEREELLRRAEHGRAEAERASRLKDEFLATVSHELRTPLNAVLGWAQMLRAGSVPAGRQAAALDTIERNARNQAQLIDDLLDVSRIMSGKLQLQIGVVQIADVVGHALETVRPAADARQIRIQTTLDSQCSVLGDASRLQQVVWNLLSNAVKFTPKGGRVRIVLSRRDSSVELCVVDTGQGIEPSFLPHVFERFRQADGNITRHVGGLGLGLSIARHLVEAHGGVIEATSEGVGQGASFVVRLPISPALGVSVERQPLIAASSTVSTQQRIDGVRVLVVDDEPDTRTMLHEWLQTHGAHVITAGSLIEALAVLKAEQIDLLISDIGMPEGDGYELIREVRALEEKAKAEVPAIALTAYARTQDRTRVLLAGFTSHMPKPVEPLELLAMVATLTSRRRAR
jgi:PAS domain S-box-containing protein